MADNRLLWFLTNFSHQCYSATPIVDTWDTGRPMREKMERGGSSPKSLQTYLVQSTAYSKADQGDRGLESVGRGRAIKKGLRTGEQRPERDL